MSTIYRPWRCGSQVGRTLYIDSGTKDPANLFGLIDDAEVAAHIVELHNWWLELKEAGEAVWEPTVRDQ